MRNRCVRVCAVLFFLGYCLSFAVAKETAFTAAVDRAIDSAIDENRIVGCVVFVSQNGKTVYRRAAGLADREQNVPMREDAVFRLASVTKAFTSMAAASLIDEGKLGLDEPVTKYLPEFRPKLADGTEPVITIRHLMSHTAGLNYGFFEPKDGPYHKAGVSDGLDSSGLTLEENLRRITSCPLLSEPGTKWQYSLSPDVLGAVIAKANGTTFQEAMKQHVTGPLKMRYAGFSLDKSPDDAAKVPTPYFNGETEPVRMKEPQEFSGITYSPERIFDPEAFPSGGGGMAATAEDVMRLLEAIRTHDETVASREILYRMDEDQTGGKGPGPGIGFGLGWSVVLDPKAAKTPQSKGTVSWSGAYGHHWFVDRKTGLSVLILTNTAFEGMNGKMTIDVRDAIYENLLGVFLDDLRACFESRNGQAVEFQDGDFYQRARRIGECRDPGAIPSLIGAIDADNTYATVYGIGWFGLAPLTDVTFSPFHDGAWWRRWWEKNKSKYPEDVQKMSIPDFPKTAYGKIHKPFPVETETVQGQLRFFQHRARLVKEKYQDRYDPIVNRPNLSYVARSIAEFDDPATIPYLIAIVGLDDDRPEIYGNASTSFAYMAGYFGLHKITGVDSDKSHDGPWWRKWWAENKSRYPESVQNIEIPAIDAEWEIPDLSKEVAEWRNRKAEALQRERNEARQKREEKMMREISGPDSDVADISGTKTSVEGQPKMEYFLIGFEEKKPVPNDGWKLLVIMPGGDGSAEFHPFIRRIYKHGVQPLGADFLAVQPVAVSWTPDQQIVWPTENDKVDKQEFSTENYVESVVGDVARRTKIDPKHVYTLSWSSSGPAAYAIALQEKTAVTGSYVLMSVFKPNKLPPLERAKDRVFVVEHATEDRVCPFWMAEDAQEKLTRHGAVLKFVEYPGGHGWRPYLYDRMRENLRWMVEQNAAQ